MRVKLYVSVGSSVCVCSKIYQFTQNTPTLSNTQVLDMSIKDTEYGGLSSREMGSGKVALSKLVKGLKCSGAHEIELTDRKGKKVCVLEYSIAWRGLRSRKSIAKYHDKKNN